MGWIRRETEKGTVQYICPNCNDYHEFQEDFGELTFSENFIFCRRCGAKNGKGDPPTITPQNEWVSVETPPTTQGWYHVAVLDLKTGKYTVEQDLYSIELAKAHGFEPGFCKANRWEERERIDYWCRFPAPPDRHPPEGEA